MLRSNEIKAEAGAYLKVEVFGNIGWLHLGRNVDANDLQYCELPLIPWHWRQKHTSQVGFCSATSVAQIPDPEPQSSTRSRLETGGNINLSLKISLSTRCCQSSLSASSFAMSKMLPGTMDIGCYVLTMSTGTMLMRLSIE